jgi:hypothetical protein
MKKFQLLIVFILLVKSIFSQHSETYQSPLIYKENKVKYRIMRAEYSSYSNNITDLFNKEGQVLLHLNFDSSGFRIETKTESTYNLAGFKTSKKTYHYKHYDSANKRDTLWTAADSSKTISYIIENDLEGLKSEIGYNPKGKKVIDATYTREPLQEVVTFYNADTIHGKITVDYEVRWVEKSVAGYGRRNNGDLVKFQWSYKNTFDKSGRLTERKISRKETVNGKESKEPYYRECNYEYNSKGLLKRKVYRNRSDGSDYYLPISFDYAYYD